MFCKGRPPNCTGWTKFREALYFVPAPALMGSDSMVPTHACLAPFTNRKSTCDLPMGTPMEGFWR